jgi:CelD/BcsL family acetyltransferase involved in cellulose biosynthesis
LLQQGFELEDRGWKGVSGSSVLSNPQVWSFYLQQGQFLAARGELLLAFLQLQGRVIAFQCGWGFRRTYYSPKIAYDEAFGHLSPGHLLMHFLLERMFAADEFDTFDFGGPLSQATAKWSTRQYSVICLLGGITPWGDRLLATGVRLKPIKRFLNSTLGTPGLSLLG